MQQTEMSGAPSDGTREPRVGVLVVAYNAASTLERTLNPLPDSFVDPLHHLTVFHDTALFPAFGLPRTLPPTSSAATETAPR